MEVVSLGGLVGGILLASWNYEALAARLVLWLSPFVTLTLTTANILAFLLIVSGMMVAASLTGNFLRSSASAIGLGLMDRLLGTVFGLARGCLIAVACVMALSAFNPTGGMVQLLTRNSRLFPYFLAGARGVSFVVPATLQQQLAEGADQIKHNRPIWIKPTQ